MRNGGFVGRRGLDVGCEGGYVGRVDQLEDLLTGDGGAGVGGDEAGLHPVEELAGCAAGYRGWDVRIDHHDCVGSFEFGGCANGGR